MVYSLSRLSIVSKALVMLVGSVTEEVSFLVMLPL